MYIWQTKTWPTFVFDTDTIASRLENVLALQKQLIGKAKKLPENLDREAEMDALIQNALQTSQIEGETLNAGSVRSSVAKQLGLEQAGLSPSTRQTESLVSMLCSATSDLKKPISQQQLCEWQAAIFPDPSIVRDTIIGDLRADAPMRVVSEKGNREIIHFEAPAKSQLQQELDAFIDWFNLKQPLEMHGIVRAAISHLWLITIHPFDDGNGRVTRALTDRALAQDEQTSIRFYSLSAAIEKNKAAYYKILEDTQGCKTKIQQSTGCDTDVTEWIIWFLDVLAQAMLQGQLRIERVINKTRFWQTHSQTVLSARQIKVLNRLLDGAGDEFEQGISASKYKSLTYVSKPTATRDLVELVTKGCLKQLPGGGRSTRYAISSNADGS
jgi:Fic family protein